MPRGHSLAEFTGPDWRVEECASAFSRWTQSGVLEAVFAYLVSDADNEYALIDITIVPAHQHSAEAGRFQE